MLLGSCFAAALGERLSGNTVCINPFGTLFNPVSIHNSLVRLNQARPFVEEDCVQMGAGSSLWCSFSHYTRFARPTKEEFLENANSSLAGASEFFKTCTHLIITFGTAWCFRHKESDVIVSNCLKRPASEFERFCLTVAEITGLYKDLDNLVPPGCKVIFTVSPIRHYADGAHGNQLSKSTLLLATEEIIRAGSGLSGGRAYFPAYEIMLDELRDYRWYASDGVHPSEAAKEIVFDRFIHDFKIPNNY